MKSNISSSSVSPWIKFAGIAGVSALTALVGYGLSRPTSYSIEKTSANDNNSDNTPRVILSPSQRELVRNRVTKTYSYLTASLITTTLGAFIAFRSELSHKILLSMEKHPIMYPLLSTLGSMILLFSTKLTSYSRSKLLKHVLWLSFNISMSCSLSILGYIGGPIIISSFLISSCILTSISLVAMSSYNQNYLKYGSLLGTGLGLLCGISLLKSIFPNAKLLDNIQTYFGITLFGFYTAYDTKKVLLHAQQNLQDEDDDNNDADDRNKFDPINEQIDLYLDWINFFVYMVKLMLQLEKKDEDKKKKKKSQN